MAPRHRKRVRQRSAACRGRERPRTRRSGRHDVRSVISPGHRRSPLARQYRRLMDNISNEFPVTRGGTLFITGVEPNSHVADVAGQVAVELTQHSRYRCVAG